MIEPLNAAHLHHMTKYLAEILLLFVIVCELRNGNLRKRIVSIGHGFQVQFRHGLLMFCAMSIMVIGIFFFDERLKDFIQGGKFLFSHEALRFGSCLGWPAYVWTILVIGYIVGMIAKKETISQYTSGALFSSALTALAAILLKLVFLRARPPANLGPFSFFNLEGLLKGKGMFQSLPSGDVAIIAGACAYVFYLLKDSFWRWLILLLPLCTAYARISLNKHWPSDTLASIGFSLILGRLVFQNFKIQLTEKSEYQPKVNESLMNLSL